MNAVLWVSQAERCSDRPEGGKSLYADRRSSYGPELDRRNGKDRNGYDENPCDPAEEALGCHARLLSRLYWDETLLIFARSRLQEPHRTSIPETCLGSIKGAVESISDNERSGQSL